MTKLFYLYLKEHNKTGMKYLGHTKQSNPYTYQGSGKYWKRHIKLHGYDVTTKILLQTSCLHCLSQTGLYFSKLFNIVNSAEWANLIPEQGDDISSVNQTGKNLYGYNGYTPNIKDNLKRGLETQKYLREHDPEWVTNTSKNISEGLLKTINTKGHWWLGRKHTEDTIQKFKKTFQDIKHQQGSTNSQFGTIWISSSDLKKSKKHKKDEPIPDGWIKGRKY